MDNSVLLPIGGRGISVLYRAVVTDGIRCCSCSVSRQREIERVQEVVPIGHIDDIYRVLRLE